MKKTIASAILIGAMGVTAYIAFKSLEGLQELDLSDPFEVDLEEEE